MKPDEVTARFRLVVVLWGAMTGGVAVFALAVFGLSLVRGNEAPRAPVLDPELAGLVMAGVAVALVGGLVFRRVATVRPGTTADDAFTAYQTHIVVATALLEGPGLLGVAVAFLAVQDVWALAVGGVTVFALVLARPRREELDRLLR